MLVNIQPQKGPQEMFLSTPADIAIYGGAAGAGKTFAELLEPLRHVNNQNFGAVIFRRESVQITNEGGLWDTAMKLYPLLGAVPKASPKLMWKFPSGAKVTFSHLQYESDVLNWQGSQIPLIEFDELTHFSKGQFFYMFSRNRSECGVRPYIRATTNPDPDSWVAEFIAWWIDQDTGYPIPERSGKIRYFIRLDDVIHWADSKQELVKKFAEYGISEDDVKSVTFIAASVYDNKILLEKDPAYLANLKALPYVERERLLGGNWKVRPAAGLMFKRSQIPDHMYFNTVPKDVVRWVRRWDLAATEEKQNKTKTKITNDPDYTAGVLIGKRKDGTFVVADVINIRVNAADVRRTVKATAIADRAKYKNVKIVLPQDPGQAGKEQAESYIKMLSGFNVGVERETGNKVTRAEPYAAQWQAGNVGIVIADWNETYFNQLEQFPDGNHDDMVDASSGGFNDLTKTFNIGALVT